MFGTIRMFCLVSLMLATMTACQRQDTHHEVQTHARDGLLGITDANPNNPMGATYRTYQDDHRVMEQAVKAQFPNVTKINITLNGGNARVRLVVPGGTTAQEVSRVRAGAQEALAAAVPRYDYDVRVVVK